MEYLTLGVPWSGPLSSQGPSRSGGPVWELVFQGLSIWGSINPFWFLQSNSYEISDFAGTLAAPQPGTSFPLRAFLGSQELGRGLWEGLPARVLKRMLMAWGWGLGRA